MSMVAKNTVKKSRCCGEDVKVQTLEEQKLELYRCSDCGKPCQIIPYEWYGKIGVNT
jgi:hypothetical protein